MHLVVFPSVQYFGSNLALSVYSFHFASPPTVHFSKKYTVISWRTVAEISQPNFKHKNASLTLKVEIIL